MQRVTIEVEFVTPAFIGGADSGISAEWNAKSIRGQLRWWLRAVAARDCGFDVRELRRKEEAIWGSTSRRSAVDVIAEPLPSTDIERPGAPFMSTVDPREGRGRETTNGPVYLGYGLFDHVAGRSQTLRPYIKPGTTARIHLIRRGEFTAHERNAIVAWLTLGGIGSRSRRGYGSLQLVRHSKELDLTFDRQALLGKSPRSTISADTLQRLPQWSCVSDFTRVFEWSTAFEARNGVDGWRRALHAAGKAMIDYRRRYDKCDLDYRWAYKPANEAALPHRVGFGLPLPFGERVKLEGVEHDRRATPLLIHIAREGSTQNPAYRPTMTFMPSLFLPADEEVAFFRRQPDRKYSQSKRFAVGIEQYRIVQNFLEKLSEERLIVEVQ